MDVLCGLRLHVGDDGCVHQALYDGPPCNSGMVTREFVTSGYIETMRPVFVIGLPVNAALIVGAQRRFGSALKLFIGTPFAAPRVGSPGAFLDSILMPLRRSHWHIATALDAATFALLVHITKQHMLTAEAADRLLMIHPVATALTFLAGVDLATAGRLLATIGDPRWHLSTTRPNRWSSLEAYLGISASSARAYLAGQLCSDRQERADLVFSVWHRRGTRYGAVSAPGNFLWRCYDTYIDRDHDKVTALLRTTSRLVRYLAAYWLAKLAHDPEMRFRHEEIFASKAEIAAFRAHEADSG